MNADTVFLWRTPDKIGKTVMLTQTVERMDYDHQTIRLTWALRAGGTLHQKKHPSHHEASCLSQSCAKNDGSLFLIKKDRREAGSARTNTPTMPSLGLKMERPSMVRMRKATWRIGN